MKAEVTEAWREHNLENMLRLVMTEISFSDYKKMLTHLNKQELLEFRDTKDKFPDIWDTNTDLRFGHLLIELTDRKKVKYL